MDEEMTAFCVNEIWKLTSLP